MVELRLCLMGIRLHLILVLVVEVLLLAEILEMVPMVL